MTDIRQVLAQACAAGLDRLDAQLLLLHAMGSAPAQAGGQRAWLLAHSEDAVPATVQSAFEKYTRQRAAGKPLAYITGRKEFFGLELQVDRRVLIPRPDTETLVSWALAVLADDAARRRTRPIAALDLGTGSGAIALALKHGMPDLRVAAVDASADALVVARANARALGLQVQFVHGSWLNQVAGRYHCIVSNPPYVATRDAHLTALTYEPVQALVAGADGLDDIRHIVATAQTCLYPGAWLLIEHGYDQASAVRALFDAAGYSSIGSRRDLAGHERCTGGRAPDAGEISRRQPNRRDGEIIRPFTP